MHENIKINVLYEGNMMNKEGKKKKNNSEKKVGLRKRKMVERERKSEWL